MEGPKDKLFTPLLGRGPIQNCANMVKRCKADGRETFTDVLQTLNMWHKHLVLSPCGTSYMGREGNNHDYELRSPNDTD
jgi:hypothetical protein